MATDLSQLKVTAKTKLTKFDVGVDPNVGTPYDIVEQEIVLLGEDAKNYLEQVTGKPVEQVLQEMNGGSVNGIN